MNNNDLTICSVYHSLESKKLLELNWDFVNSLNPKKNWIWKVADNRSQNFGGKICDEINKEKFQVVAGCSESHSKIPERMRGSFHHALALNNLIRNIETRFLVILDNDFFVLEKGWINLIISYMKENNLAFFGAAYNPRRFSKYRYFPSAHQFFFVDGQQVSLGSLDFKPRYLEIASKNSDYIKLASKLSLKKMVRKILKRMVGGDRLKIGGSRDTGYGIYARYGKDARFGSECVLPVFKPHLSKAIWLDNFLPERFSFVPKRREFFSAASFGELGFYDAMSNGWEEYIWQERPFGVHLRKNKWPLGEADKKILEIKTALWSLARLT